MRFIRGIWAFMFIPIVVGAPFLLIGLSEAYNTVQLERSWVSTRGTLVDNVTVAFATGASYAPVVDFQTLEGKDGALHRWHRDHTARLRSRH